MKRNVIEMKISELHLMINYFLEADHSFLLGLGVDPTKLPQFDRWYEILQQDFDRPVNDRQFFYLVWDLDGIAVGHSHVNDIVYAKKRSCTYIFGILPNAKPATDLISFGSRLRSILKCSIY